jgi:hypothetical protein
LCNSNLGNILRPNANLETHGTSSPSAATAGAHAGDACPTPGAHAACHPQAGAHRPGIFHHAIANILPTTQQAGSIPAFPFAHAAAQRVLTSGLPQSVSPVPAPTFATPGSTSQSYIPFHQTPSPIPAPNHPPPPHQPVHHASQPLFAPPDARIIASRDAEIAHLRQLLQRAESRAQHAERSSQSQDQGQRPAPPPPPPRLHGSLTSSFTSSYLRAASDDGLDDQPDDKLGNQPDDQLDDQPDDQLDDLLDGGSLPQLSLSACAGERVYEDPAEAARGGVLSFIGVAPECECFVPNSIPPEDHAPYMLAAGARLDDYRERLEHEGYDPVYGFGTESSRPPDYKNPEDMVAYPFGVVYEGTPEYDDITAEMHEETFSEASYAGEPDYLDDRPNDCDDPEGYDDWYERNRV